MYSSLALLVRGAPLAAELARFYYYSALFTQLSSWADGGVEKSDIAGRGGVTQNDVRSINQYLDFYHSCHSAEVL